MPLRLPLFDKVSHVDLQVEPQTKLPRMLPGEQVIEDYRYLSLSLRAHPVSFLREEFHRMSANPQCRSSRSRERQKG